jgi:Tfp pilus assembly protein PilW
MKPRQQGFTLISLLIGLLMSLVVIISMLGTYKGVVRTLFGNAGTQSTGLAWNAQLDGQLTSGMLSAQLALQEAGYGVPSAVANTHFLVITSPVLNASTNKLSGTVANVVAAGTPGNALLWETNTGLAATSTSYQCSGLLWRADPNANSLGVTGNMQLLLLQTAGPCHPLSTTWTTAVWTSQTLVASDVAASVTMRAALPAAGCWPFGAVPNSVSGLTVTAPSAKLQVSLSYQNSTTGASNSLSVCLSNFQT